MDSAQLSVVKVQLFSDESYTQAIKRLEQASGVNNIARKNWADVVMGIINEIGGSYYWPVLALTNLGWHYLYLDPYPYQEKKYDKEIDEITSFIEHFVPDKYLLAKREKLQASWGGTDVLLFATLGKLEMLRGYQTLRLWRNDGKVLDKALEHISLALEYNYLAGPEQDTYNSRRAEMGFETRIKNSKNWQTDLLPKLFAAESIVGKKLIDEKKITKRHVLLWLERRYGPAPLWIDKN